jgi:hypothetical protein
MFEFDRTAQVEGVYVGLFAAVRKKTFISLVRNRVRLEMGETVYDHLHNKGFQRGFVDAIYEAAWRHFGHEEHHRYLMTTGMPMTHESIEQFRSAAESFVNLLMCMFEDSRQKGVRFTPDKVGEYEVAALYSTKEKFGLLEGATATRA